MDDCKFSQFHEFEQKSVNDYFKQSVYIYLKLRQVKIFCSWKKCWLGSWKGTKSVMWLKGRVGSLGASKYYFPPQLDFSAVLYLWQTPPLTNNDLISNLQILFRSQNGSRADGSPSELFKKACWTTFRISCGEKRAFIE